MFSLISLLRVLYSNGSCFSTLATSTALPLYRTVLPARSPYSRSALPLDLPARSWVERIAVRPPDPRRAPARQETKKGRAQSPKANGKPWYCITMISHLHRSHTNDDFQGKVEIRE